MISRIGSSKPMSSMRSASSSTSTLTWRRSSSFIRSSSCTRPGVPTTTCGACPSEASCGPSATPPVRVSSFRLGTPVASLRTCLLTWSASSRVGHSTRACSLIWAASIRCSRASPKAAVLPLPVGAWAIRSRPSSRAGRLGAWTGVSCTWPRASRPWNRAGWRGRSLNSFIPHDTGSGARLPAGRVCAGRLGNRASVVCSRPIWRGRPAARDRHLRNPRSHALTWLIFLLLPCAAFALDSARTIRQLPHTWFENQLPQATVLSIVQRADGSMWLATYAGLAYYSGAEFDVLDQRSDPTLRSSAITALFEDSAQTLWVGTLHGGLYRSRGRKLEVVKLPAPSESVCGIAEGEVGALWLATNAGIARRDATGVKVFDAAQGFPAGPYRGLI